MNKDNLKIKLDEFINQHRLSEYEDKTLIDYKIAVNNFIDFIPENKPIDKELMLLYKKELKSKYSISTINKYVIVVNKFLKYLGYEKSVLLKKEKTQQKTYIDDPIWEQEHKRMLRWAKKLGMYDMYLIMKIFVYTGARINELKVFKVENIDNYIKVISKGKERKIILRNDLKRELKNYCKENKIKSGYIFRSPVKEGKMLHYTTIWRRLKKIAGYAKINKDKIHPHAWRHLFSKEFIAAGGTLDELSDIMGHSKIETTRIYTMTSNREKREKLEKIKM